MLELLKIAAGLFQQAWEFFFSPRYYCWQTFLWLTIFSVVLSALATGVTKQAISTFGYAFLIFGFTWAGVEYQIALTPWITSALILHLLSGLLSFVAMSVWMVLWLPLAALLASFTLFVTPYLEFQLPSQQQRQRFLLLLGSQVLLACWLQFSFMLNHWLERYPSLLADDFSSSLIVVRLESRQPDSVFAPRGDTLLATLQPELETRLSRQAWSELQPQLQAGTWGETILPALRDRALAALAERPYENLPENELWELTARSEPRAGGYQLIVVADWQGPRSRRAATEEFNPYQARLVCLVEPRAATGTAAQGTRATCMNADERRQLAADRGVGRS